MTMSPTFSPTSDSTPKVPTHLLSPSAFGQLSPTIPETLRIPMGKYHPSNYKSPASTEVSTPTSNPRTPLPPTNLSIPTTSSKRGSKERPGHERKSSDIKRKLQQYQREMIAQARAAAPTMKDGRISKEPSSPRLQPLGSPGPITPFDLEEADGYIVAGSSDPLMTVTNAHAQLMTVTSSQYYFQIGKEFQITSQFFAHRRWDFG